MTLSYVVLLTRYGYYYYRIVLEPLKVYAFTLKVDFSFRFTRINMLNKSHRPLGTRIPLFFLRPSP